MEEKEQVEIKGKRIAYVRVSTIEQNETRQIEALQKYNIDKWYIEKVSGKDTNRPKLQEMLEYVREGDIVYIHDFSRLARNTKDLLDIVEKLEKMKVHLFSEKDDIDTSKPMGVFMLTVLGAIAELERQNLLERQREGIEIAKREGKYKGGQVKRINDTVFNKAYQAYKSREINKKKMAEQLHISRPTLDKLLKEKGLA